jgi:hypothetical protein
MGTDESVSQAGVVLPSRTTRLQLLGVGLIALAFIGPYLAAAVGIGEASASQAGQDVARTLGSLLFLALIAWAATRGRSDATKASARVVVGLVLCIVVATNIARAASDTEAVKTYLLDAVQFRDAQTAKFTKLGERFDTIDLAMVLTPPVCGHTDRPIRRQGHAHELPRPSRRASCALANLPAGIRAFRQ